MELEEEQSLTRKYRFNHCTFLESALPTFLEMIFISIDVQLFSKVFEAIVVVIQKASFFSLLHLCPTIKRDAH